MFERCIYVLAFSDGVVKVGSTQPSRCTHRTKQHAHVKRRTGARVVGAFYTNPTIYGYGAELQSVGRIAKYAQRVVGREWFQGVRFEQAIQSVTQTIRRMAKKHAANIAAMTQPV